MDKRASPEMPANWRRRLPVWIGPLTLVVILLASLIIGWFLRDMFQSVIDGLAFGVWSLGLRLRGLPQDQIWGYLVVVALIHLVWLLTRGVTMPALPTRIYRPAGPVEKWMETLTMNMDRYQVGRIPLGRLQQVTLAVLSQRQRQSLARLRGRLRSGQLDIDPDLQTFLQTGESQTNRQSTTTARPIMQSPEMEALLALLEENSGGIG